MTAYWAANAVLGCCGIAAYGRPQHKVGNEAAADAAFQGTWKGRPMQPNTKVLARAFPAQDGEYRRASKVCIGSVLATASAKGAIASAS